MRTAPPRLPQPLVPPPHIHTPCRERREIVALGLSYRCGCGVNYKVYMPKRKIFGEIVNRVVDWQAVDAREEAAGEVEEVQRLAEISHCSFIDGRVTSPDCTSEIDLTEYFRTRMISAV